MTLLGKILVLANFALSVMVMVGAMILYFDRVDWTEGPVKPEEKWGELRKRNERVKDAWEFIRLADLRWRDVHAELLDEEGYRAADRPWYLAELKHDRDQATEMNPARTVIYANGVLVLEPVANEPKHLRPKMMPAADDLGQKLASLTSYNTAEEKTRDDLIAQQKAFIDLIEKHRELANRLTPEAGKGLRVRIEDEKVKINRLEEELAILRPLRVNTEYEVGEIGKRDQELTTRIKELKAALGLTVKQP